MTQNVMIYTYKTVIYEIWLAAPGFLGSLRTPGPPTSARAGECKRHRSCFERYNAASRSRSVRSPALTRLYQWDRLRLPAYRAREILSACKIPRRTLGRPDVPWIENPLRQIRGAQSTVLRKQRAIDRQPGTPLARWPCAGDVSCCWRLRPDGGVAAWRSRPRSACAHPAYYENTAGNAACSLAVRRQRSEPQAAVARRGRLRPGASA
jgi:hypothetical protein